MPKDADLYLSRLDLAKYCPAQTCDLCRADSFADFLSRLETLPKKGPCHHISETRIEAFRQARDAKDNIPPVPMLTMPKPVPPALIEILPAGENSPVLLTGNSEFTVAVLLSVVSLAARPIRVLSFDTRGHTVDMAMIFKEFSPQRAAASLAENKLDPRAPVRVVIPGLARDLAPEFEAALGRPVEVGPVCAAELPLFMEEDWL